MPYTQRDPEDSEWQQFFKEPHERIGVKTPANRRKPSQYFVAANCVRREQNVGKIVQHSELQNCRRLLADDRLKQPAENKVKCRAKLPQKVDLLVQLRRWSCSPTPQLVLQPTTLVQPPHAFGSPLPVQGTVRSRGPRHMPQQFKSHTCF